jgi:23S rRNA (adenine2503-C2)-methyltransferase
MGEPTFNPDVIISAVCIRDMVKNTKVSFNEYHPVVSTMMPAANKNLEKFLNEWIRVGYVYGGKDGFGLQFSINTLNEEDRNAMFDNKSLSLAEIGAMIDRLPRPKNRKFTLNFAVTSKSNLDPDLMEKYFDKTKCIVKITPIHETHEANSNGISTPEGYYKYDVYRQFEQPLIKEGWQVIVFIPSKEEDEDRITCGNALLSLE